MPEGPEIRRAADSLEAAIKGKPLTDVWFAFPELPTAHVVVDTPKSSVRAKRILPFMIVYKFIVFFLLQRLQK